MKYDVKDIERSRNVEKTGKKKNKKGEEVESEKIKSGQEKKKEYERIFTWIFYEHPYTSL